MTKKKDPKDYLPVGAPSKYRPEYCELLIKHMSKGGTMESFPSKLPGRECLATVYNWLDAHPEFLEARKHGMARLHEYYEGLGRTIASGQLRRVKSERPVLDAEGKPVKPEKPNGIKGKPVYDKNGEVLYEREYEPAQPGQSTFIFMTKNMLGWRDRKDVEVTGKDGGPINFSEATNAELEKELAALIAKAAHGTADKN